ncbi:MAG: hypothetical protein WBY73_07575, partial [Candidatus Acidiferrales bacterium]
MFFRTVSKKYLIVIREKNTRSSCGGLHERFRASEERSLPAAGRPACGGQASLRSLRDGTQG